MRDEGLRGEQDRFDVDGENPIELRLLNLHDRLVAMRGAGVVDDNVDAAERVDRLLCGPLDILALRHVGGERDRARANALGGGFSHFAFQVEARNPGALARENLGDAVAEPLPRAGHQRRLAV